jgi:hypothetical protein
LFRHLDIRCETDAASQACADIINPPADRDNNGTKRTVYHGEKRNQYQTDHTADDAEFGKFVAKKSRPDPAGNHHD